jgi:UDP-glucose 4-epimerase
MKILVSGSGGFVGGETCKLLEEAGHEVIKYDLMDGYDIMDINQLMDAAVEADRILHLAAIVYFELCDKKLRLAFETNVLGTKNVAEVAKLYHIPVVYASTGSVYMPITQEPPITEDFPTRGNSVYGCTKAVAEKYIEECNPNIILRYAHIYGREKRHHGLIGNFIGRVNLGLQPEMYGGKQSADFVYIKDVAKANVLALTTSWDKWNEVYNVGSGEELTVEKAMGILKEVTGYDGYISEVGKRSVDPNRFFYDTTKAETMLGFKATYSFKDGLVDMNIKGDIC